MLCEDERENNNVKISVFMELSDLPNIRVESLLDLIAIRFGSVELDHRLDFLVNFVVLSFNVGEMEDSEGSSEMLAFFYGGSIIG